MKLPICRCGIQSWSALGSLTGCNQSKNLVKLPQVLIAIFWHRIIVLPWPCWLRRHAIIFYPRGCGFKSHQTQNLFLSFFDLWRPKNPSYIVHTTVEDILDQLRFSESVMWFQPIVDWKGLSLVIQSKCSFLHLDSQ